MWLFNLIWFWCIYRFDNRNGIFTFWDGVKFQRVDALQTARSLMTHSEFDWDETPQQIRQGTTGSQLTAIKVTAEAVREAFQIPDVSAGGLSEMGCSDLLIAFRAYLNDVKKNGSLWPTSSDSRVSELPALEMPAPLPNAGSVSGSTPSGPSVAPHGSQVEQISSESTS